MNIIILSSTHDAAGVNIQLKLIDIFEKTDLQFDNHVVYKKEYPNSTAYLILTNQQITHAECIDTRIREELQIKADILLFATKHASKSEIPSYCVHTQGNWNQADLGGNPQEVASCPVVLKNALYRNLHQHNLQRFDVVNEATHHGPTVKTPSVFIEIGSIAKQWNDDACGKAIANTIDQTLTTYDGEHSSTPVIFGIGGNHTCINYNELSKENVVLLGHVCPSFHVDAVTVDVLKQAFEKHTIEPIITIDWKSLKSNQRVILIEKLESAGLKYKRLKEVKTQFREDLSANPE
ncbi:MAG: D-aminoacyl-tRNA deacylase [Candidatus Woesearchaeota archaeon]|jgi:D-aminoacyl-tRNA deacylase